MKTMRRSGAFPRLMAAAAMLLALAAPARAETIPEQAIAFTTCTLDANGKLHEASVPRFLFSTDQVRALFEKAGYSVLLPTEAPDGYALAEGVIVSLPTTGDMAERAARLGGHFEATKPKEIKTVDGVVHHYYDVPTAMIDGFSSISFVLNEKAGEGRCYVRILAGQAWEVRGNMRFTAEWLAGEVSHPTLEKVTLDNGLTGGYWVQATDVPWGHIFAYTQEDLDVIGKPGRRSEPVVAYDVTGVVDLETLRYIADRLQ